jgi:hypothetical protein
LPLSVAVARQLLLRATILPSDRQLEQNARNRHETGAARTVRRWKILVRLRATTMGREDRIPDRMATARSRDQAGITSTIS